MDSDESYHSESEFYYPNEEDKESNAVRLYFRFIIYNLEIKMLFTGLGRSVLGKTVPSVSSTPSATVFPNTDRPRPVNNIYFPTKMLHHNFSTNARFPPKTVNKILS